MALVQEYSVMSVVIFDNHSKDPRKAARVFSVIAPN